MIRALLNSAPAAALALVLCSCASNTRVSEGTATATLRNEPDRLIVVTIDNPASSLATRAGSTLRGYDGAGHYSASGVARSMVAALEKDYALHEVAAWPIEAMRVHCIVFRIPDGIQRADVLTRLAKDSRVKIAQPLQVFATSSVTYNDPYLELQSGFKALDTAAAHQWSRGEGVRVAVIDTGLDSKHPDLAGRVIAQRNFVDGDARQFLADRHGTGIAGVIAATGNNSQGIVGVAPGVQIVALKACWQLAPNSDDARCNSFTLAQALAAALESNSQIVNLSVSGPADPLLNELLKQGLSRGVIFVGAAPRDGKPESFPVSTSGVIAVDPSDKRSGFRDAVPAPGTDILTLTPQGHYDFSSGASLATAHVTGAVALLLQKDKKLTTQTLVSLLQKSRDNTSSASINACNAVAALTSRVACNAPSARTTAAN